MDYKKKYEKANAVLVKIQEMIDNNNLDALDFCENVCHLLKEYNK
jgi:hypothetical protein